MRLRPRLQLNTVRARILLGLGALALGLVITAATGAAALSTIRTRIASEMDAVRSQHQRGLDVVVDDKRHAVTRA